MNFKSNKRKCAFFNLRKYFSLMLVLCLWAISPQLKAQSNSSGNTKIVKGVVMDESNDPMIGVNVMEKGTTNGTITDFNGKFQLKVANGAKLVLTYIGYATKEAVVGTGDLKIAMAPDAKQIEEIVVVGYANQTRKSVVAAVAQTSSEDLKSKGTLGSLTDALSGAMPGVTVMTNSSAPGGGGVHGSESVILIRGQNSWNSSAPLIMVDGMERNMSDVSIDEVENFSVLKDASATAVYGVKGANGVILITTKRGIIGKAKITAEANFSSKSISRIETTVDAYKGLLARNYAIIHELPIYNNTDLASYYTSPRILGYYRDGVEPEKYTNVDWPSVMLRDNTTSSNYNINVSGGTNFVKYFTTLSYLHEGDILNSGTGIAGYNSGFSYDRLNFRTNLDFSLTKTTTFKVNLSGYFGSQEQPADGSSSINNVKIWQEIYKANPISPLPIYSDGMYGADDPTTVPLGKNSLFYLLNGGTLLSKRTSLASDFDLEQKLDFITKGLSMKGRFSFDNFFTSNGRNIDDDVDDYTRKYYDIKTDKWVYNQVVDGRDGFDFVVRPVGYTNETINGGSNQRNLLYEMQLNYSRSFGKHNVTGLALFSREKKASGSNWPTKREDWVGRLTYNYDGKYLLETNGAYNGSELFGDNYKFDFFPSIALGWRVSEEKFMKNNLSFISNLKLRYSIGYVGSDNLSGLRWAYLTTWNKFTGGNPSFGSALGTASFYASKSYQEGSIGNPDLHWETVRKQNFGVEIGLFKDLITATVDRFIDYRYDMLIRAADRAVPVYLGANPPPANLGSVNSSGYEVELKIQKKFGKANLWASCNWSKAINKVIFRDDAELESFYLKAEGYKIGQVRTAYVSDFITNYDDLYTGVMNESSSDRNMTLPGSVRTLDYNGDGVVNVRDNAPYGYSNRPENTYSFSLGGDYKGFSVSAQFYGIYNVTVNTSAISSFQNSAAITYQYLINQTATPEYGVENPGRSAFRLKGSVNDGNLTEVDGSMFRLKTLQISYSIPSKFIKPLSIENLKFFVSGNNLFLWSKLPHDVEGAGLADNRYPTTKAINFGMKISL